MKIVRPVSAAFGFAGVLLVTASWTMPEVGAPSAVFAAPAATAECAESQGDPLGTYIDCQDSCRNCQKACESKSAGSERSDCMRSCTASAAGCCAGYGKKPPPGLTCYCQ